MPDIAYAGAAFAAITQAIDTAKMLKELGKRIDNAEIISQVADLTLNLAEIKIQLAQALEDNIDLRQQLSRENMVSVFGHWLYLPSDPAKRRPICHVCYPKYGPMRMREEITEYFTIHKNVDTTPTVAYLCDNCQRRFDVDPREVKKLLEILERE